MFSFLPSWEAKQVKTVPSGSNFTTLHHFAPLFSTLTQLYIIFTQSSRGFQKHSHNVYNWKCIPFSDFSLHPRSTFPTKADRFRFLFTTHKNVLPILCRKTKAKPRKSPLPRHQPKKWWILGENLLPIPCKKEAKPKERALPCPSARSYRAGGERARDMGTSGVMILADAEEEGL